MRLTIQIPTKMAARLTSDALEGLARAATSEVAAGGLPGLYASGVRYQREPQGQEVWQLPSQVLATGNGDCEDLSAWRVGELRASGADPRARVGLVQTGPRMLHAIVVRGDGSIEDPSRALGMQGQGGVPTPQMLVGVEPHGTWCEVSRRGKGRGPLVMGRHIGEALAQPEAWGVAGAPYEVGVLDTIARAAQGALSTVLPGLVQQSPQAAAPRPNAAAVQQMAQATDISASDILRVAADLARIVDAERRRDRRARAARVL